ncbi:ABC transporter permease [Floricoccus penangensis]|uniref:ABC transporter permease n=1 Tax=Floricoccus penangensis TaxID=1859475 RepID=A0A9Q5NYT5_9LACT|nr:ABC transporter permease [Floricoccus penangensis]OFI45765.1 ABC transporter permease [Floricoccus penangensis]
MNIYVNFQSALKAVKNNKKRSLLTMFGIVIGIAAVIAILAIGRGFEKATIKNLTNSDSKNVEITINFTPSDTNLYQANVDFFKDSDINLLSGINDVKKADYAEQDESAIYKQISFPKEKKNEAISLAKSTDQKLFAGRNLTEFDNDSENKVAVIDKTAAEDLAGDAESALGQGIEIDGQLFNVVGVTTSTQKDSMFVMAKDNIFIPKNTYHKYFENDKDKSSVKITLKEGAKPDVVTTEAVKELKEKGSMRDVGKYEVYDTKLLTEGLSKIFSTITMFITAVAGISLVIAGVGVMNMMYISVSERTKEIGIRRALGATRKSIMLQFLIEGLILTLTGGFIGYLIGIGIASIAGKIMKIPISVDLFTISIAVGVSTFIGLVFSVMPASEASKKDLIDILR